MNLQKRKRSFNPDQEFIANRGFTWHGRELAKGDDIDPIELGITRIELRALYLSRLIVEKPLLAEGTTASSDQGAKKAPTTKKAPVKKKASTKKPTEPKKEVDTKADASTKKPWE